MIPHTNFYEKALFVKPTWRLCILAERIGFCPSRYASIRTLRELTLFGGSVHYEIRLLRLIRRCNLRSGLSSAEGGPSSQLRSHL
jgi:hypothetical protein